MNIQAKNGEGAGAQQNTIINRTASVDTADENSPDFVQNSGDLWVKKLTGYVAEVTTLEATLPSGRTAASAATAPNGKIYVFGGRYGIGSGAPLKDIIEFDPVAQTVTTLEATLPSARYDTSAATAPNGKIYVFGGDDNGYLKDIIEFDPVAQTVTTLEATLPSARYDTSAATAPNGKIYVFGGRYGIGVGDFLDDIIEFDPVTQAVTTLEATLPNVRDGASAATAPNGKIYVFGGYYNFDGGWGSLKDIIEFDPVTQSVTTLEATLPTVRYDTSAATAPNGKIYVFGGYYNTFASEGGGCLDDIIEFDPVTQAVTTLEATLPSGRTAASAATAPNGKIYVFGGYYNVSDRYINNIVEFDPSAAQYAYRRIITADASGTVTASSFNATT